MTRTQGIVALVVLVGLDVTLVTKIVLDRVEDNRKLEVYKALCADRGGQAIRVNDDPVCFAPSAFVEMPKH